MTTLKLLPIWRVMCLFLVRHFVSFMTTNVHNLSLVKKTLSKVGIQWVSRFRTLGTDTEVFLRA